MKKKILSFLLAMMLMASAGSAAFGASGSTSAICGAVLMQQKGLGSGLGNIYKCISTYVPGLTKPPVQQPESEKPVQQPESEQPAQQPPLQQSKASEILSLVNKERAAAGLSQLILDTEVNAAAQLKAEDMAKNRYFSHNSPTYGSAFDMLKNQGISYRTAGENIASEQPTSEAVMRGWMNSQGHRANILGSSYSRLGVGYAVDSSGKTYWVQIFVG